MHRALKIFYILVFAILMALTIRASLAENVLAALERLWPDPWFLATLADATFAFATIALWILWRERFRARGWAIGFTVFGLGNLAIATYLFWSLHQLKDGEPIESLLRQRPE
jgi:hypothetical protein